MKSKEIEKLDMLIGFINDICEIVSNPDEYLDPNTKDSPCISIGYSLDKNEEPVIETIDGDSISDLEDNLNTIRILVESYSKVNFSKQWEELR